MKQLAVFSSLVAALALGGVAAPPRAATFDDPDWPCIQRKVPELSIGQMWAGPVPDETVQALAEEQEIADTASALALRRVPLEQAEEIVATFAERQEADRNARLTALFVATFDIIGAERDDVMSGIARYAHKQTDLSETIEDRRAELVTLEAETEPDFDRIEEIEDTLLWEERIYNDRRQSLTYVCETPVLLEQRAFAIARMIMSHLEE